MSSGDPHQGAVTGTVEYSGGEFHVRIFASGRDWNFRALSVDALRDQVCRFFSTERRRVKLKLSRASDLAQHGEKYAIAKV